MIQFDLTNIFQMGWNHQLDEMFCFGGMDWTFGDRIDLFDLLMGRIGKGMCCTELEGCNLQLQPGWLFFDINLIILNPPFIMTLLPVLISIIHLSISPQKIK